MKASFFMLRLSCALQAQEGANVPHFFLQAKKETGYPDKKEAPGERASAEPHRLFPHAPLLFPAAR